jgi:hypothetical protein
MYLIGALMEPTSEIDPHGQMRKMPIKDLLHIAQGCQIEHDKKKREDLINIIERCLTVHEWGTLFTANELSAAAKKGGERIDAKKAMAKSDKEGLARFHALVSDCDHWFLAYSYFIGDIEYGFIWETPYDEIHRGYNKVKVWYDDCGSDTYFTIAYCSKDPKLHFPTVKKCKDLVNVQYIGKKVVKG